MTEHKTQIQQGWQPELADDVAQLYEQAFGHKFASAISDKTKRKAFLAKCFLADYSFVAMSQENVVGIAGFQTPDGTFTGGITFEQIMAELGWLRGLKACAVFSLFERKAQEGELVMDGIAVDAECRGQGLGGKLLDQIIDYARLHHYQRVRLDVIDSNPRAKKLYEAKGFVAEKTEHYPYLKWLLGFSGSTTMVYHIN